MPAILRADGSSILGMGHIMRGVALAAGLKGSGVDCIFVTRALDSPVAELVGDKGFEVKEIPPDVTDEQDAELTKEIAAHARARLIVTDICHRETQARPEALKTYHRSLAQDFFTVVLTGDKQIDLAANIVITPYAGVTGPDSLTPGKPVYLIGPSYFIFRSEFIAVAQSARSIGKVAKRVLITVGGSDELRFSTKIVQALCSLTEFDLNIRMVVGAGYTQALRRELTELLSGYHGDHEILDQTTKMAEAMEWADLAITGDGLTKYEAAVTGTPCIVLSRGDSEMSLTRAFEKLETSLHVGDGSLVTPIELAEAIEQVLKDPALRNSMSQRGKALVDGKGIDRIIANIPEEILR